MSNLTNLSIDSPEFAQIEFNLRLHLKSSTAQVLRIQEISNPHVRIQFDKKTKQMLKLDSWLDVDEMKEPNTENSVSAKGFKLGVSKSNTKFSVGRISVKEKATKKFMFCKIAVGHSCCATEEYASIGTIPEGYDSFLIDNQGKAMQKDISNVKNSIFEYIIKDSNQVLPMYIATFSFDPEEEARAHRKLVCDNCEKEPASIFCQADNANLCVECDKTIHASKLAKRHNRMALDKGTQSFSHCRIHQDKIVEFFCPTCNLPVCVHCKMVGHHSAGETTKHKLVSIMEAYHSIIQTTDDSDAILEKRIENIKKQAVLLKEREERIVENSKETQAQLDEMHKKATTDLIEITKKKINVLKADYLELTRQMDEIESVDDYLVYQKSSIDTTQFILDWNNYLKTKTELHNFMFFKEAIDAFPDIKISGAIQVVTDSEKSLRQRTNQSTVNTINTSNVSQVDDVKSRTRKTTDFFVETLQSLNSSNAPIELTR